LFNYPDNPAGRPIDLYRNSSGARRRARQIILTVNRHLMSGAMRPSLLLAVSTTFGLLGPSVTRAQGDNRYVAPSRETVTASLEQSMGSIPAQLIWVQNNSTVPIHVYGVFLRNCENILGECGSRPVNVAIRPGGREIVERIERHDNSRGMHFGYGFSWRADSASLNAVRLLARNGVAEAQQTLTRRDQAIAEENAAGTGQDLMLAPADVAALGTRVARLRFEPDSVVLHVGQAFLMHQVHLIAYDSTGAVLGRVRGYQWRIPAGPLSVQRPDTVTALRAGRTAAEFQLVAPAPQMRASLPIIVTPDSTD
jgi:hypothetical protein